MREYILNKFGWITPTWYFIRASLASFGALCLYLGMFHYHVAIEVITSGLFIVSIGVTLALEALLLGFTLKAFIMNLPSGGGADKEKPSTSNDFLIKDDSVYYSPDETLRDLKKQTKTRKEWWDTATKYNKMEGYGAVRTYCLSQAQKV